MKENTINYQGIKTNNLKNFDIDIEKGSFIGVSGPSGSGKSSLVYSTIYAIAQYEWEKVANVPTGLYEKFRIDSYKNVIPALALRQENFNNNPRSTIATFLRIDKDLRLLFAASNNVSPSIFSFNNPQNACPRCTGLGVETKTDEEKLIEWDKSIAEKPFIPWRKNHKQKLLEKYAASQNIPLNVAINKLPEPQINQLLHGSSENKFPVSYKMNGKQRTHNFRYIGLLDEFSSMENDKKHISSAKKIADFGTECVCSKCKGMRFADKVLDYTFYGKNLGELYMMELEDLEFFISSTLKFEKNLENIRLLKNIHRIVKSLVDSKLEYLHLNRSIPTLSGGELQRIRLTNILTSQIENMMYIIDEPSARLHISEYDSILSDIQHLNERGNTILMIEHNPYFLNKTQKTIVIGPKSGNDGGYLLEELPEDCTKKMIFTPRACSKFIHLKNISDNNIHGIDVDIPLGRITSIYGPSGSGKSTLAKNIQLKYENTEYVNQKPIRGSKVSTIASYSEILDDIKQLFAKKNKEDVNTFSFTHEEGQCPCCGGKGYVTYELDFGKTRIDIICDECGGKRYNKKCLSFKYKGLDIYQLLTSTIDSLIEKKILDDSKPVFEQLSNLQKLGLGYLNMFRTTDTLSGGEAQRLKLMKFIGKKCDKKLFIFDEPLRGLSKNNALDILSIFNEITDKGGTVVFIEHNVIGLYSCDYVIEMGPGKGKNGGELMFSGSIDQFKETDRWNYYIKYLK